MGVVNTQIEGILTDLFDDTLIPGLDLTVDVTYNKVNDYGTYSNGTFTPSTTSVALKAIIPKKQLKSAVIGNEIVSGVDAEFYIEPFSGLDVENYENDTLSYNSTTYHVVSVKQMELGGTQLVVFVQCRRM